MILTVIGNHIPHMEEHSSHVPDSFPLQHNRSVLPVSKALLLVDILICQIYTTGKSHISINNTEFPMITVILDNIQDWTERIEHLTLDSFGSHGFIIFMRERGKTSHVIINQTDIHTFLNLPLQYIQYGSPHYSIMDYKILNKNIMLCLLQFPYKNREHVISNLEIFCGSISVNRITCIMIYIIRLIACRYIFCLQKVMYFRICL